MNPDLHRLRAQRIEHSLRKLDDTDHEMRIEAAMLAGTHWANFALHRRGVTPAAEDIVHTTMLVVNMLRKYAIAEGPLLQALAEIEDLRPLHVRGDMPGSASAGRHALELLAQIHACACRA